MPGSTYLALGDTLACIVDDVGEVIVASPDGTAHGLGSYCTTPRARAATPSSGRVSWARLA